MLEQQLASSDGAAHAAALVLFRRRKRKGERVSAKFSGSLSVLHDKEHGRFTYYVRACSNNRIWLDSGQLTEGTKAYN